MKIIFQLILNLILTAGPGAEDQPGLKSVSLKNAILIRSMPFSPPFPSIPTPPPPPPILGKMSVGLTRKV